MAVWKPKTEVLEETKFADTWWWTFRVQELEKINFHCSTHPVCGILSGQPYNTNICIVRSECSARKTGAKSFHRESARDPLKGEDVFTRNTWGRAFLKEKHANTSCLSICSYSTPVHYWSIYYKVNIGRISSVQFSQSCLTLCTPMDCTTPGFPVHHQFPELAQTHVHQVDDAFQPSHPLSSRSPSAFSLSQLRLSMG